MIPLIIIGSYGRMGQAIIELVDDRYQVVAGVVKAIVLPQKMPLYLSLKDALANNAHHYPVIIDFSSASSAHDNVAQALAYGLPIIIGTTGENHQENSHIINAAQHIPILLAANTSVMALVMMSLCKHIAKLLPKSQKAILDIHHQHKKDAPSGTAKDLKACMGENTMISSWRLGEIIGEHQAVFVDHFEELEIKHRVLDRKVFAQGALIAAKFLFTQEPGLYDMADVLNL